jgi:hypothetical protein
LRWQARSLVFVVDLHLIPRRSESIPQTPASQRRAFCFVLKKIRGVQFLMDIAQSLAPREKDRKSWVHEEDRR